MLSSIVLSSLVLVSAQSSSRLPDSALVEITRRFAVAQELVRECVEDEWDRDTTGGHPWSTSWVTNVEFGHHEINCIPSLDSLKIVSVTWVLYQLASGYSRGRIPSPTYWVAFDSNGNRYRIRGFNSSAVRLERERMVKNLSSSGWTNQKLLDLAELYFTITRTMGCWGRGDYKIVNSCAEAENHYREYIEAAKAEAGDDWPDEEGFEWIPPKIPDKFEHQVTAPTVVRTDSAYTVSFVVAEMGARAFLTRITTTIDSTSIVAAEEDILWYEP